MKGCLVAALALLAGCPHPVTYGYQYRVTEQFAGGEEPEPPPVEARQLLANAKTVAFFPPDNCLNTQAQQRTVSARCGALLSKLERDAERAGYEVVSWVNLRGEKRPIDYAREAHVDVLFEINELLPQQIKDADVQRKLTFFDRDEDGRDSDLQVTAEVADRCAQWAKHDQPFTAGITATLDIKTTSVADGRARWHYRKTVSQSTGAEYPKVKFDGVAQPNNAGQTMLGIGIAALAVGGAFALADAVVYSGNDPMTGMPKQAPLGDVPTYMAIGGAVLTVIGGAIMAGNGVEKPDPDKVLCLETHVPKAGPVEKSQGPTSSEHTFNETTVSDPLAKEEEKMAMDRVEEFFKVVADVHANTLKTPTPPPAEPPPPAPAPPKP